MFDGSLGHEYIRKVLVHSEEDRALVLDVLYKNHIHFIHGKPVEEAVLVSSKLTPEIAADLHVPRREEETLYDYS